jgi:hypothetical protein
MATFYLDLVGGNDANDGTSFANRWLTFGSGATAARTAPGDTIRLMASPDPTLVGSATWTNASRTITLASAVTTNICDCETAWTGSANVSIGTGSPSIQKEGTKLAVITIQDAFSTGLAAYFATGTLDLSAYQQVSFWISTTATIPVSSLTLRLCSDTAGATTVHTVPIPAIPASSFTNWMPVTVDFGTNLNSSIASIALYCEVDNGAVVIRLDNIIACKAASSADALTFNSLIGKVHNLSWIASTSYAVNDIRRPTQPNRNGYKYKVTAQTGATGSSEPTWPQEIGVSVTDGGVTWQCEGLEDTWYGIASINGTTVRLDGPVQANSNSTSYGYPHTSETIATYRREPLPLPLGTIALGGNNAVQESGTAAQPIVYKGGWNRTDMSTQTGETWVDGGNGMGIAYNPTAGMDYVTQENLNSVRCSYGVYYTNKGWRYANCHHNNAVSGFSFAGATDASITLRNVVTNMCSGAGMDFSVANVIIDAVALQSSGGNSVGFATGTGLLTGPPLRDIWAKGNKTIGFNHLSVRELSLSGFVCSGSGTAGLAAPNSAHVNVINGLFSTTAFSDPTALHGTYIYSHKHNQTADNHLIWTDGGSITSATDQRHTASGISWKFRPTSTNRSSQYPLRLSVAKIAVSANAMVTLSIWTRRDNTNIAGQLIVLGGQLAGVGNDVSVSCTPSVNTWVQSSLTFTPTEAGVVEALFLVWDGVGTTNNFWIDDISISQS